MASSAREAMTELREDGIVDLICVALEDAVLGATVVAFLPDAFMDTAVVVASTHEIKSGVNMGATT